VCTVSFVPLKNQEFILTSNRDETVARGLASAPTIIQKKNYRIVCPVDPLASGTWIAASDYGDVICLLNGAFGRHKRKLPYRMSRGLVVPDYFEIGNPEIFNRDYDLTNIEPFTLVMVHRGNSLQLFELKWDGSRKYFQQLHQNEFHLWSSPTLYKNEMAEQKKIEFRKELDAEKNISPEKLIAIHRHFLYENWVRPPERVEVVSTLSITSVKETTQLLEMNYRDLVRKEIEIATIRLPIAAIQ